MKTLVPTMIFLMAIVSAQAIDINFVGSGGIFFLSSTSGNVTSSSFNLRADPVNITGVQHIDFYLNGTLLRQEWTASYYMCGDTNNVSYNCFTQYPTINWTQSKNITAVMFKNNVQVMNKSFILNPGIMSNFTVNDSNQTNQTNSTPPSNDTNASVNVTALSCSSVGICINGSKFLMDGKLTFPGTQIEGSHQTLRAANGLFDTKVNASFFDDYPLVCDRDSFDNGADFGRWNATANTARLIDALPYYKTHGVDTVSVSFQGGCSCSRGISGGFQWPDNNPFHSYGNGSVYIEQAYLDRALSLIQAARAQNMTVITNLMYFGQEDKFSNDTERVLLARYYANWLIDNNVTNVLIETGNERSPKNTSFGAKVYFDMIDAIHDVSAQRNKTLYASFSLGFHVFPTPEYIGKVDYISLHTSGTPSGNITVTSMVNSARDFLNQANLSKPVLSTEDNIVYNTNNIYEAAGLGIGWGYYNDASKQSVPANYAAYTTDDNNYFTAAAQIAGLTP